MEQVVLVDTKDNPIGFMEKIEAHRQGVLHRAFSIILFNKNGDLLLQKRASHKYHSGGLWTNTCCSHQRPGEENEDSVKRRLREEMNLETELYGLYSFIYKYEFGPGLIEHELDHVYYGEVDQDPVINTNEASDWKWISWENLLDDIRNNEEEYTFWFKEIILKLQSSPALLPLHLQPKK